MFKKTNYRFALTFLLAILFFNFLPLILLAQTNTGSGLVPCGTDKDDCTWYSLVILFGRVTDFVFTSIMIPLAVVALVYAGIKVIRGQTKPAELIAAKGVLANVALGIFMALGAYAIVKTVLTLLAGSDSNGIINQAMNIVFQ